MSLLKGIVVDLHTGSSGNAGTDDHVYIGVVSEWGGREFPLAVKDFNDYEKGTKVTYALGEVWAGWLLDGAKNPDMSIGNDHNDPRGAYISVNHLTHVYIRKAGSRQGSDDDMWELEYAKVGLFGSSPDSRTYETVHSLWLGNQFGQQTWLTHTGSSGGTGIAIGALEVADR